MLSRKGATQKEEQDDDGDYDKERIRQGCSRSPTTLFDPPQLGRSNNRRLQMSLRTLSHSYTCAGGTGPPSGEPLLPALARSTIAVAVAAIAVVRPSAFTERRPSHSCRRRTLSLVNHDGTEAGREDPVELQRPLPPSALAVGSGAAQVVAPVADADFAVEIDRPASAHQHERLEREAYLGGARRRQVHE